MCRKLTSQISRGRARQLASTQRNKCAAGSPQIARQTNPAHGVQEVHLTVLQGRARQLASTQLTKCAAGSLQIARQKNSRRWCAGDSPQSPSDGEAEIYRRYCAGGSPHNSPGASETARLNTTHQVCSRLTPDSEAEKLPHMVCRRLPSQSS